MGSGASGYVLRHTHTHKAYMMVGTPSPPCGVVWFGFGCAWAAVWCSSGYASAWGGGGWCHHHHHLHLHRTYTLTSESYEGVYVCRMSPCLYVCLYVCMCPCMDARMHVYADMYTDIALRLSLHKYLNKSIYKYRYMFTCLHLSLSLSHSLRVLHHNAEVDIRSLHSFCQQL